MNIQDRLIKIEEEATKEINQAVKNKQLGKILFRLRTSGYEITNLIASVSARVRSGK